MKKKQIWPTLVILALSGIFCTNLCNGQNQNAIVKKYLMNLPSGKPADNGNIQKYRMTAIYTNMDIYGNFSGKIRVSGDYTRGLPGGYVKWNNVSIAESNNQSDNFGEGKKQEFMENFRYIPSDSMLQESAFKSFPNSVDNIYSRNLIWDMMSIEMFAWRYNDSLKVNKPYVIPISGGFDMAEIGKYYHESIQVCWTGISMMNNELCSVIEYRAMNNRLEIAMENIKTKGTEQYWGNTWISLRTKQIEYAEMYGASFQEIEVQGMKDKFMIKTIRDLFVERIK